MISSSSSLLKAVSSNSPTITLFKGAIVHKKPPKDRAELRTQGLGVNNKA
jgi:hypothetical protein